MLYVLYHSITTLYHVMGYYKRLSYTILQPLYYQSTACMLTFTVCSLIIFSLFYLLVLLWRQWQKPDSAWFKWKTDAWDVTWEKSRYTDFVQANVPYCWIQVFSRWHQKKTLIYFTCCWFPPCRLHSQAGSLHLEVKMAMLGVVCGEFLNFHSTFKYPPENYISHYAWDLNQPYFKCHWKCQPHFIETQSHEEPKQRKQRSPKNTNDGN